VVPVYGQQLQQKRTGKRYKKSLSQCQMFVRL
jgi:hypothetical protein